MSHFRIDIRQRAEEVLALYPRPRSAMLPLLAPRPRTGRLRQRRGYRRGRGVDHRRRRPTCAAPRSSTTCSTSSPWVATSSASARTSPACSPAATNCSSTRATSLGCPVGATSSDGLFTLEETECLADCDFAPVRPGEPPLRSHDDARRLRRRRRRAARGQVGPRRAPSRHAHSRPPRRGTARAARRSRDRTRRRSAPREERAPKETK